MPTLLIVGAVPLSTLSVKAPVAGVESSSSASLNLIVRLSSIASALATVGFTPSTLWSAEAARPVCINTAVWPNGPTISLFDRITVPLDAETPSPSSSFSTTVYVHTKSLVGAVPIVQSTSLESPVPTLRLKYGSKPLPLSAMFLSNVMVTTMSSPIA